MTKKRILWGMPAMVFVCGLVLAGCASAPTNSGGGGNNADPAAAKLAKDLKAIGPKGGTVTLSDRVRLNTALTVPEGVILDLTAEGAALELQDGAVLTVNGTVRATGHGDHGKGWVDGSLRVGDGVAVINGSGTINLTSKGRLLNIGSDKDKKRQLTLDGVTLAGLPDNDHPLVGIGENGVFILKSGKITGNTRSSDEWAGGGGVAVYKGTFTMEGGTISGNSAQGKDGSGGGGVRIGEEAVFTMIGGEITGNSASGDKHSSGGGVDVWRGTFTMEGGTISGNSAQGKDGSGGGGGVQIGEESVFTMSGGIISGNGAVSKADYASGGGVRVYEGSTFTMSGGEISGNSVNGGTGARGGGVAVEKGTFTMSGGTITGNNCIGDRDVANGGGVDISRNNKSVFTMTGGRISGNTLTGGRLCQGAGVSLGLGPTREIPTFIMQGGTISGNTATGGRSGNNGGGVMINAGMFILEGGTIYGSANRLPAGTDASLANSANANASLHAGNPDDATTKWGSGGTYTKGGVSQSGGSNIGSTNDTLIAIPAK
ncbi:MAG: hypothetical protein LBT00_06005 [Spirochaetaceae bacterium]|jgi:hypothetical protein|nr:hypothetical protein [Spirochaetaceae bacterium]